MDRFIRNWRVVALRGLAALIVGIIALVIPGFTLAALVLLFGAYLFIDGILAVVTALSGHAEHGHGWVLFLEGLAGIAVGVITFFRPGVTTIALVYLIAAWALVTGVLEIVAAIRLRRLITNEWLLALAGVISIVLAVVLAIDPFAGAFVITLWIGAYALVFGILLLVLAFRMRRWAPGPTITDTMPTL